MMQNNKMNKIRQLMKTKGYYIVLFLCLIAVGTSGYLYYRNRDTKQTKQPKQTQTTFMDAKNTVPTKEAETEPAEKSKAQDVLSPETVAREAMENTRLNPSMPLEGDAIAAFSADHLSYNETTKDWRTHTGIDIAAELGEEVHAAADGIISAVYDDKEFGKTVVIEHKGDYKTYYSNLAPDVLVEVGERVTAGTLLGAVGQTAICEVAAEPHLHFAVYHGAEAVDPEAFFSPESDQKN